MALDLQLRYRNEQGQFVYPDLDDEGVMLDSDSVWMRGDPGDHAMRGCLHRIPAAAVLCPEAYGVHNATVWRGVGLDTQFVPVPISEDEFESFFNVAGWVQGVDLAIDDSATKELVDDARYYIRAMKAFSDRIRTLALAGAEPEIRFV